MQEDNDRRALGLRRQGDVIAAALDLAGVRGGAAVGQRRAAQHQRGDQDSEPRHSVAPSAVPGVRRGSPASIHPGPAADPSMPSGTSITFS